MTARRRMKRTHAPLVTVAKALAGSFVRVARTRGIGGSANATIAPAPFADSATVRIPSISSETRALPASTRHGPVTLSLHFPVHVARPGLPARADLHQLPADLHQSRIAEADRQQRDPGQEPAVDVPRLSRHADLVSDGAVAAAAAADHDQRRPQVLD